MKKYHEDQTLLNVNGIKKEIKTETSWGDFSEQSLPNAPGRNVIDCGGHPGRSVKNEISYMNRNLSEPTSNTANHTLYNLNLMPPSTLQENNTYQLYTPQMFSPQNLSLQQYQTQYSPQLNNLSCYSPQLNATLQCPQQQNIAFCHTIPQSFRPQNYIHHNSLPQYFGQTQSMNQLIPNSEQMTSQQISLSQQIPQTQHLSPNYLMVKTESRTTKSQVLTVDSNNKEELLTPEKENHEDDMTKGIAG